MPDKGGCGTSFPPGAPEVEQQPRGRVPNPDIADVYNTVAKMAHKRALVMAAIQATAASDIFTQDVEDMLDKLERAEEAEAAKARRPDVETPPAAPAATEEPSRVNGSPVPERTDLRKTVAEKAPTKTAPTSTPLQQEVADALLGGAKPAPAAPAAPAADEPWANRKRVLVARIYKLIAAATELGFSPAKVADAVNRDAGTQLVVLDGNLINDVAASRLSPEIAAEYEPRLTEAEAKIAALAAKKKAAAKTEAA